MKFRVQTLVMIGFMGILLIALATGWLVWLNWNDKVQASLFNFLLLGVLTVAGATLLTLQETVVKYPPSPRRYSLTKKRGSRLP